MLLKTKAKEEFDIKLLSNDAFDSYLKRCEEIYKGTPDWLDDDIHTVNLAKSVCSETARLTCLGIGITVDGSARAEYLQKVIDDKVYFNLRHWIEYGCAYGTVILKPNGEGIDLVTPQDFVVTDEKDGVIRGVIFESYYYDNHDEKWYTRLEYHRFLKNGQYAVSNRCFVGNTKNSTDKAIDIKKTPWKDLAEDMVCVNVDKPLYGVFKTPMANNIVIGSCMGLPMFGEALEELKDLDVAYSLNAKEILNSKRTVLLDSDRLTPTGGNLRNRAAGYKDTAETMGLPDFVKVIEGQGNGDIYHEINPTLNTTMRLTGINAVLSQIGYKCGFSNGYFVFNEKSGMITATQVEADDRKTIQLIKDVRDGLESCIDGLTYAIDRFADFYNLSPVGKYEITYDFGDITYNREEDRARWFGYVAAGKVPFWRYLMKFEGFSEEDAKEIEAEAQPQQPQLMLEE